LRIVVASATLDAFYKTLGAWVPRMFHVCFPPGGSKWHRVTLIIAQPGRRPLLGSIRRINKPLLFFFCRSHITIMPYLCMSYGLSHVQLISCGGFHKWGYPNSWMV
jgi:hypothetical protein